ncbi:IPT/TIG domain-containing protein [Chitinophaga ginsengisoli]|uniref:NHL repeat-containing protein n=1 Tax=Chitinophaga ginsengisoli TaxID=363837 RepID=A0A2P8FTI6_9BACT|nr:IPT/TIG domain-containing protein [Chitinophaga ginsengisoli]PSL25040.1 NHL repeat-containing protein [Chitinophaga ginsengisoli]
MKRLCFPFSRLLYVVSSILLFSACSHDDNYPYVTVTSIYPEAAGGGDTVKIYGTNFPVMKSGLKVSVSLNGEKVNVISATKDSVAVVIPVMAGSGDLTVQVDNHSYSKPFTYNYVATVTTIAGTGAVGRDNGAGNAASFNCPWGLTVDSSDGTLYVADCYNRLVRKIAIPGNTVSTIPISYDVEFYSPRNITLDQHSKQLYLTDFNTHVMRIEPDGRNVPIYQGAMPLAGIALGPDHHLYVANTNYGFILRMDTSGHHDTTFASGITTPQNIVFDRSGTMWVSAYPHVKITPDGQMTFLPLDPTYGGWEIALDRRGNLYEADHVNNNLRLIEKSTGRKVVIAGSGTAADIDGVGLNASFNGPQGLVIDRHGDLYISTYNYDTQGGNKIRKIVVR